MRCTPYHTLDSIESVELHNFLLFYNFCYDLLDKFTFKSKVCKSSYNDIQCIMLCNVGPLLFCREWQCLPEQLSALVRAVLRLFSLRVFMSFGIMLNSCLRMYEVCEVWCRGMWNGVRARDVLSKVYMQMVLVNLDFVPLMMFIPILLLEFSFLEKEFLRLSQEPDVSIFVARGLDCKLRGCISCVLSCRFITSICLNLLTRSLRRESTGNS